MTNALTASRIVVGVDGTAASTAAVEWAAREARLRHATVCLVRAVHDDPRLRAPYAPWARSPGQAERAAAAHAQLDAAAAVARRLAPSVRIATEVADELPARALISRAADAELLVLGTTRPAGQRAGAIGPVARSCVRSAPCTVVIITPDEPQAQHDTSEPG